MLSGCITNLETLTRERKIYSFDYLTLLPNQTIKTEQGTITIIEPIRIWSDKAYLEAHEKLLLK